MAAIATLCILLSLLAPWHWFLALLEHPRPQYCWAFFPVLTWASLTRRWRQLLWSLPLVLNLLLIGPAYWPAIAPPVPNLAVSERPTLTMIHLNLDRDNPTPEKAIAFLQETPADWLWLQEVTPQWLERLEAELSNYKLLSAEPRPDSQGVALLQTRTLSQLLPPLQAEILHFPHYSPRPMIAAQGTWLGQPIALLSLHTTRPRNRAVSRFQNEEFTAVAIWLNAHQNAIALGDFNATPWSTRFRQFLKKSGCVDSLPGWGWQTTWHAGWPKLLQIPIDHMVHHPEIVVRSRSLGPAIGSDHRPLIITWTVSPDV